MPVTGATTRNDYIAGAGQNVFTYTFQIILSSDLKVIKNDVVLSLNTDYTVAIVSNSGGFVTLSTPASSGDTVSVFLAMPIDRTTEYQNAGDFLASDVNGDFDKGYVAMNQLQTDIGRSIHLKDQDPTVDMGLPIASLRADKYLTFDASGRPTVSGGGTASGGGSIPVTDFGVVADGITDNTVTLQTAVDFAAAARRPLYFPASTSFIRISGPIYVRSYSRWFGEGEIKNTNTAGNINSAVLMAGSFNPVYFRPYNTNVTGYTHYPINAVNSGRTITTTTASNAGNFSAGDLVWVSTITTWVGSAGDYPITAHLSEVVSANASTGDVVLDTPISEEMADLYGSLRVCKAEDANISDIKGNPLEFCKYATIDGISITAPDGAALTRGGMYKCDFNFKDVRAKNAIFANAFVNTSVRAQTVTASRKACDIAGFSGSFYIGIDSLVYDGQLAESNLPAFCRVGECGRNGVIESFNANCGGYIDPDPIAMIDGGSKNVGQIHHSVVAPDHGTETSTGAAFRFQQAVSSNRQIYIASPAWAGSTAFALSDRVVNGGNGYQCITAGTSASSGGPTGTGSSISDGTAEWKYVTNVSSIGDTVLNYGTTFDDQGADRTATLKVYLNNVIVPEGAGAGKYTKTGTNTTITLGTALLEDDRVKIGLDSDYQKSTEDCWMDINATLGSSAARGVFFADGAQDAIPPTLHHIKRCGFKNLKIDAPSDAFAGTNQAVNVDGEHSYIDDALINSGKISVSTYADYATIRGYYEEGVTNNSPNSNVRITSKRSLLCDVGNQINDQILIQTTATTDALTAVFPADSLYIDDRWTIKGTGRITGTNGEKKILFYDDDTVFFTFTIPAGTTGNFSIELQLIPQSLTQYTAFGVLNVEGAGSVSYDTDTSINYGTPTTFKVGANVANTSDGVRFHNLDSTFTKPYHLN